MKNIFIKSKICQIWSETFLLLSPSTSLLSPLHITYQGCKTTGLLFLSSAHLCLHSLTWQIFILQLPRAAEYTAWTGKTWPLVSWGLLVSKREPGCSGWGLEGERSGHRGQAACERVLQLPMAELSAALFQPCGEFLQISSFKTQLKHLFFCDMSLGLANEVPTLKLL